MDLLFSPNLFCVTLKIGFIFLNRYSDIKLKVYGKKMAKFSVFRHLCRRTSSRM